MHPARRTTFALAVLATLGLANFGVIPRCFAGPAAPQTTQPAPGQVARRVGTIKAIKGNAITLTPDNGPVVTVLAQDKTRFLRIALGQKSLRDATPAQLQDLQVGDRILVGGRLAEDAKSVLASTIVVMKRSDVEAKQKQEREDWQKRGLGGLVSAVDPAGGTITVSVPTSGGTQPVTIYTTKQTIMRRYAPDSVKFEDTRPGTLQEIQPGDQLRARGSRSADGSELTADEVVSGTFRNIAGTIAAIDPVAKTLRVLDLATKKPVLVKITGESQLRQLPPAMAEKLAARLKKPGERAEEQTETGSEPGSRAEPEDVTSHEAGSDARNGGPGGPPNLQQVLSRMPAVTLSSLQKGDAVMIVSTQGEASGGVTAITLLSGVEPILEASPKGGQGMTLSPWTLSSSAAEAQGDQ
jgi:hypothetical protein